MRVGTHAVVEAAVVAAAAKAVGAPASTSCCRSCTIVVGVSCSAHCPAAAHQSRVAEQVSCSAVATPLVIQRARRGRVRARAPENRRERRGERFVRREMRGRRITTWGEEKKLSKMKVKT